MARTLVTLRLDGVTDDAVTVVAACSVATSEVTVLLKSVGMTAACFLYGVLTLANFADVVVASFNVTSPMLKAVMVLSPAVEYLGFS